MKQELECREQLRSNAQQELGMEVFRQLADRLENLEEKYGREAAKIGVEYLAEEVESQ